MSTLAERIGQGYILEDEKQSDKQISISGIKSESMENKIQGTTVVDITREQWFWDMGVMS